MAFLTTLITAGAPILGGLLGSKNKAPTTTDKKEPWAPAQPYLIDNLATNKQLQGWYQQNPFNAQQKQGYQNLFSDQDNFRGNVAPGLMQFANNLMGAQYQRQAPARPGGGAGYGGGLLGPAQQQAPQQGGLLSVNRPGPFSVAQTTPFGQINWNAQNPFYKTPEQLAESARLAEDERLRKLAAQQQAPQIDQSASSNWNAGFGA